MLTDKSLIAAARNSLFFVLFVTAGCLAVGVPLAWLVARTDVPAKLCLRGAIAVAFIIPSFINVIAWIFLAAPNSGTLNKLLVSWLGLAAPPFNIFSFGGLVFIETAHLFPIVFFAVAAALANIDASHEQAARMLGAGRWRTTRTITLPLVAPAIISSATLCMLDALSSFGAPAAIGTMANFSVLSTAIYGLLTYPPRLQLAAAVSLPIALFTLVCLWAQQRYLKRNNFVTVTGKANAPQLMELGAWRYPALAIALTAVGCASVLPFLALLVLSLIKAFGTELSPENFGLQHYRAVFDDSFTVLPAVKNSLILALCGRSICVVLGIMIAWLVERTRVAGRGIIGAVVMVGLRISLHHSRRRRHAGLYQRALRDPHHHPDRLCGEASADRFRVRARLDEAGFAGAGGGGPYPGGRPAARPLRHHLSGAAAGGLHRLAVDLLALPARAAPMSAILTQSGTEVMSTMVLQFIEDGSIEVAAAISVLIVVVSMVSIGIARIFAPRKLLEMR